MSVSVLLIEPRKRRTVVGATRRHRSEGTRAMRTDVLDPQTAAAAALIEATRSIASTALMLAAMTAAAFAQWQRRQPTTADNEEANDSARPVPRAGAQQTQLPEATLEAVVDHHLVRVVETCDGNRSAAARALGMHRRSLQRKLAKLKIPVTPAPPSGRPATTPKEGERRPTTTGVAARQRPSHEVHRPKTAPCAGCGLPFPLPPWPIDGASMKCIECANPVLGATSRRPEAAERKRQ